MSRAFVKEDASHEPVVIPPRPPLPDGTPNYVTPRGLALLKAELQQLLDLQSRQVDDDEDEDRMREQAVLRGRIAGLRSRLAEVQLVATPAPPLTVVRFGTTVRLEPVSPAVGRAPMEICIVGVDEADAGSGQVSFLAPIARQLLGRGLGERVRLAFAKDPAEWEIADIS